MGMEQWKHESRFEVFRIIVTLLPATSPLSREHPAVSVARCFLYYAKGCPGNGDTLSMLFTFFGTRFPCCLYWLYLLFSKAPREYSLLTRHGRVRSTVGVLVGLAIILIFVSDSRSFFALLAGCAHEVT